VTDIAVAWPRQLRALPVVDVLVACIVALLSQLDVWAPLSFVGLQQHRPVLAIVFLAVSAALAWRRRAPLAVLAFVVTTLSVLYIAVGAPEALGTFLPPLVAIYSVGATSSREA
jgi:hypothetical protein